MGEIFERVLPATPLDWTGERLTTETSGQVEIEHLHRYFFARQMCRGLDALDIGCGEGYGTMLLAQVANSVVGVDVSSSAIAHASEAYVRNNLKFRSGDATSIPLEDQSVDVVVSFETIEHFYDHARFLAEVKRVLRPSGRLLLSSPERDVYSPEGGSVNPFHVHELTREEFSRLLGEHFSHLVLLGQRTFLGSALIPHASEADLRPLSTFERRDATHFEASTGLPRAMYLVAVASDSPMQPVGASLHVETGDIDGMLSRASSADRLVDEVESKLNEIEQLHEQLVQADELVNNTLQDAQDLRVHVQNQEGEIAWLRAELESRTQQRDLILNSRSWQLTEPLREISRAKSSPRLTLARTALSSVRRAVAGKEHGSPTLLDLRQALGTLPARATVLVASGASNILTGNPNQTVQHFPQNEGGGYLGRDPADALAAIAQLEALRARGAEYFLLPAAEAWWVEHYQNFHQHLSRHYRLLTRTSDGDLLFSLRQAPANDADTCPASVDEALAEVELDAQDGVSILDWHTRTDMAARYTHYSVLEPPDDGVALPYLDGSIDVVAIRTTSSEIYREARRVARAAVLSFPVQADDNAGANSCKIDWLPNRRGRRLPSASVVVRVVANDPIAQMRVETLCASLPTRFDGEVLLLPEGLSDSDREFLSQRHRSVRVLAASNAYATVASADVLVFLGENVLPLPDWLTPLLETLLRKPDAAVVGGRVVGCDGRLREAGGLVSAEGVPTMIGADHVFPDDPVYAYSREVDWCSLSVLATWRRSFIQQKGFDTEFASADYQAADYCLRVRANGGRVEYQPASTVVRLTGGTDPNKADSDETLFRDRWALKSPMLD